MQNQPTYTPARSRQRSRTERAALLHLNAHCPVRSDAAALKHARNRIKAAKQPAREVRKVLAEMHRLREEEIAATCRSLTGSSANCSSVGALHEGLPDHSDIQELRVKLLRRDRWLDPLAMGVLASLDADAARGTLTWQRLDAAAARLIDERGLPPVMPAAWRKAEAALATA